MLLDALRPHLLSDLLKIQRPMISGVVEAVGHGAYDPSTTATAIVLDFRDPEAVAEMYAADSSRVASATFETAAAVEAGLTTGAPVGWALIQLYYAAFYAGHTLLRFLGRSCTYFPQSTTGRLSQLLGALAVTAPFKVAGGLYACTVCGSALELLPLGTGIVGGSHEAFWRCFLQEIDRLSAAVLRGPLPTADAQEAAARLIKLRETLAAGRGTGEWLSTARNELQYRHGYGVWYPERLRTHDLRRLTTLVTHWRNDDPVHLYVRGTSLGDLFEFASACVFMVAIARSLVLMIGARAPRRGRSFVDYGPARLLRELDRADVSFGRTGSGAAAAAASIGRPP